LALTLKYYLLIRYTLNSISTEAVDAGKYVFPFRKSHVLSATCCPCCYPPRIIVILRGLSLSSDNCCYPPTIIVILQGSSKQPLLVLVEQLAFVHEYGGGIVRKRHSSSPEEEGTSLVGCSPPFYVQEGMHAFLLDGGEFPVRLKVALYNQ
jgi:hypothetical protein